MKTQIKNSIGKSIIVIQAEWHNGSPRVSTNDIRKVVTTAALLGQSLIVEIDLPDTLMWFEVDPSGEIIDRHAKGGSNLRVIVSSGEERICLPTDET